MFRSLSPRRSSSARPRPAGYRLHLEALEERLPPGDTLGWLLGWSWLTSDLPLAEPALPPADALVAPSRQQDDPPRLPSDRSFASTVAVPFAPRSDSGEARTAPPQLPSPGIGAGDLTSPFGLGLEAPRRGADDLWPTLNTAPASAPTVGSLDGAGTSPTPATRGQTTAGNIEGSGSVSAPNAAVVDPTPSPVPTAPPAAPPPPAAALAGRVHARFGLSAITAGPFPSNRFTVADASQNTGRRVNLPLPDPATRPSDYEDVQVLNTLDGFNLQPRLSIPFDGPIDVSTVNSNTVFLVNLGSTGPGRSQGYSPVVGINQVVWDTFTNTLHVESDELLAQHTRYALIVTNGVRDLQGRRVEASLAFRLAPVTLALSGDPVLRSYGRELTAALGAALRQGVLPHRVVTASVFTTQSTTAVLEKIRDQIHAATPEPADFLLGPGGERTVFPLDQVTEITWNQQTRVTGPLNSVPVNLLGVQIIPGVVSQIAFGRYLAPDYLTATRIIPPVGTRTGTPIVQGMNELFFNLYLPSGPKPTGGWPVAIYLHAGGGSKNVPTVAASLAAQGIANIAISGVGHGFGPLSTLTVHRMEGGPVTFPAAGRGIDMNGDGVIGSTEGFLPIPPSLARAGGGFDGHRQTAADHMQLVRVIEAGMDVDGDGDQDLNPSRIYYVGPSFGGINGTILLAVEPNVRAGVLTVPGGSFMEIERLAPSLRSGVGAGLAQRVPSLISAPGITSSGGIPVGSPHFNENKPLRNQPPVINTVAGAMAIQEVFDWTEWFSTVGDPVACARHLRKDPLPGVPAKSVIVQFAKGDQTASNPVTVALLRAGDLADRATYFRNDLAFAENPRCRGTRTLRLTRSAMRRCGRSLWARRNRSRLSSPRMAPSPSTRSRAASSRCRSRDRCRRTFISSPEWRTAAGRGWRSTPALSGSRRFGALPV